MVFLERPATSSRTCDFVLMGGNANTARDTIHSAIFDVLDTDMTGAYICKPKAIGSASVHK